MTKKTRSGLRGNQGDDLSVDSDDDIHLRDDVHLPRSMWSWARNKWRRFSTKEGTKYWENVREYTDSYREARLAGERTRGEMMQEQVTAVRNEVYRESEQSAKDRLAAQRARRDQEELLKQDEARYRAEALAAEAEYHKMKLELDEVKKKAGEGHEKLLAEQNEKERAKAKAERALAIQKALDREEAIAELVRQCEEQVKKYRQTVESSGRALDESEGSHDQRHIEAIRDRLEQLKQDIP